PICNVDATGVIALPDVKNRPLEAVRAGSRIHSVAPSKLCGGTRGLSAPNGRTPQPVCAWWPGVALRIVDCGLRVECGIDLGLIADCRWPICVGYAPGSGIR